MQIKSLSHNVPSELIDTLVEKARLASDRAYAPYSKFRVGAALVTSAGKFFDGCNVENASYGLAICAERNAIFKMISEGEREILALVVFTPTDMPSTPCGACRQVISEFGQSTLVIGACNSKKGFSFNIAELLPHSFSNKNLDQY